MADIMEILVVDDDINILRIASLYLRKEGYTVRTAQSGPDALEAFRQKVPDLVLLDVMLPGMDGFEVLKALRTTSSAPVIMLTAKSDTADKVVGLELGADDYMVKPFEPSELLARIKAVIRRFKPEGSAAAPREISFPDLTISLSSYRIIVRGESMDIPPKEMDLLYHLASHAGDVFTREQLLEQVWGFDYFGDTRTVDVHIKRLREKLGEDPHWQIKTVWGVGYKFELT
ncbi:MAG: response regulator [Christensenellales bacterium]